MSNKTQDRKVMGLAGVVVVGVVVIAASAYYIGINRAQTKMSQTGGEMFYRGVKDNSTGGRRMGDGGQQNGGQKMQKNITITKEGELTEPELQALGAALADELKAFTFYTNIIARFGDVRPFVMIVQSEAQHISRLHAVYEAYGIQIPTITPEQVSVPSTVQEACQIGVQAEIDNAAMYQELISKTNKQSIIDVFTALSSASTNNHQVAFERCGGN
ncbi:hypothetical protein KAZ66_02360 [Candidatus Woesebacteria bacterium]|nr:hypothetical protein [Candidatus Woesebacteria bacterium]